MVRCLLIAVGLVLAGSGAAEERVVVGYLHQERMERPPVSPLDKEVTDRGLAGARLGLADNESAAKFTGQSFALLERRIGDGDLRPSIGRLASEGVTFVISDLEESKLTAGLAMAEARDLVFVNVRETADSLRMSCQRNLMHAIPSRAMLADALAQYLVAQRWRRWFLVVGRHPSDKLYAAAIRRAAGRFGAEIAIEKEWSFRPGNARADTGHVTVQAEVRAFTQVADHDVLVVADEEDEFGEYPVGRTARPRPVAGTHGLVPTGFDPVNDQWGAAQLHSRFERRAGRRMGAIDYAAWAAMRAIGEAAMRTRSSESRAIAAYMRSDDFLLSGFKGQGQSFRSWSGQMRQPILIVGPRLLVSVSPQAGFLHRRSELDTLGLEEGETKCGP
jgi:ABC transporter substrate binding protein (PQQ-dependent alcohol dehydrogenase system)